MSATNTPTATVDDGDVSDAERDAIFKEASEAREAGNPVEDVAEAEPAPAVKEAPEPTPAAPAAPAVATPAPTAPAEPAEKSFEEMTTDELREAAKKWKHERESAVGRAAALQRAAEARTRVAPVAAPAPAPLPEAERLDQAFPELNAPIQEMLESRMREARQEIQQQIVKSNLDTLTALHGESWPETMQSDEFHYWLSKQPAEDQQRFHSNSVADYAKLLTGYRDAIATPPTTAPAATTTEADRLQASRAARLNQNAAAPRGRQTVGSNTTGEPDAEADPEAYFKYISNLREAKRMQAERRR